MPNKTIPNALLLQSLVSIEAILGQKGLDAVLSVSGLDQYIGDLPPNDTEPAISFSEYARLNLVMANYIGRASKGILIRIGRRSFQYGVREQAAWLGLTGTAMKLLPKRGKVKFVLNAIGNTLRKTSPEAEFWVDDRKGMAYCVRDCAFCEGLRAPEPVGHLLAGSLAEACKWATGEDLRVTETMCMAKGDEYGRWEVEI